MVAVVLSTWLLAPAVFGQQRSVVPGGVFQPVGYGGGCGCAACDSGKGTGGGGGTARVTDGGGDGLGGGMGGGGVAEGPTAEDYGLLAGEFGGFRGALSAAPDMIGDFFGGGYRMRMLSARQVYDPDYGQTDFEHGATIPIAAGDRRFKIADNNRPIPTDRFFVNYNHFSNAVIRSDGPGADVDRAVFGLEKTFRDGLWSFEFRIPFASGLDADQARFDGDNLATEFGNVAFALKRLVYGSPTLAAAVGLGMVIPTAEDATLSWTPADAPIVIIENEALYLQPFFGVLWTPNERVFTQLFAQLDFDTNGNTVRVPRWQGQGGTPGVIQDQSLLYLDYSFGYWLFRDPCSCRCLTGLAPMLELHYTTTLQDSDTIYPGLYQTDVVTNFYNRQDVLNLTAGLCLELRGTSYLRVSAVAPLKDDGDRVFDGEINAQFVARY